MKITKVEIFDVEMRTAIPLPWHPVLVRVHTDEGITGVGEVGLAYGIGHAAGAHAAREIGQRFFIGADPFRREALWEDVYRGSFWGQSANSHVLAGLSGLDTALWDIQGKALGLPCYQLLGGKTHDRLKTYASQLQLGWGDTYLQLGAPEDYGNSAAAARDQGFTCVKVDPINMDAEGNRLDRHTTYFSHAEIELFRKRMAAVRDALGPEGEIILEVHSLTSGPAAVQLADALHEYGIYYFEEPVSYTNSKMQSYVAGRTRIPLAAGERIFSRWGLRPYLEEQSFEVLQPDIGLVGGLTEAKKMCDYAHIYDVTVQTHVCGSPVATAASLHLEAAIPNFLVHEHHSHAMKSYNVELCDVDLQPKDGFFEVPDRPGLGIELNDAALSASPKLEVTA
ncbi:mandelate racemase/muconate lactonizing enzyme family protein [Roseovarius atlanticus]|uniref:mandelate racemase/muconate lactonizing enzyme family protein n=1 Tax=Roseovarius atlanticus TaxID=1641875 RepID=UPI001C953953|nr:mandelate racemase/muconate lactonizing enzyme family protein [Roseovarius atlanticus]MBY5986438.1 mandelate racemase/muconate lactonizing enzyme family protein [Roseovarius atlanticus]MBY6125078.1 mandelate racemase/muconate lactonizing enzyme family protein [Roseovarius atlanticus]MBY6150461.1 mandelate racemase/muconate lactonizing enzyme family protein [Roseovarius atlanticus]